MNDMVENDDSIRFKLVDKSIKLQLIDLPSIYHMEDQDFKPLFKSLDGTLQIKYFSN